MKDLSLSTHERFWKKVHKTGACWIWKGGIDWDGYGKFQYLGRNQHAHRVSYQLKNGDIPAGTVVRHSCDVRLCVNPEHLIIGTHVDNVRDRQQRNRQAKGERQWCARLTESLVLQLRRRAKTEGYGFIRRASRETGIPHQTIQSVLSGKTWRHLLPSESIIEDFEENFE